MTVREAPARALRKAFGFWTCLAIVVGNMIGAGVYLLPATLAPFGWNGVIAWLLTIAGAVCLAAVFAALARGFPRAGGPYAFAREAFGPFVGFLTAWLYWVSIWTGNVAIATGVVAPLATLFQPVGEHSVVATLAVIWLLTAVNCIGMKAAGQVQVVTTGLKFLPLLAVLILALFLLARSGGSALPSFDPAQLRLGTTTGIAAAATVTLFAFLGLETATIPAEQVEDAGPTIFKATLVGTVVTGLLYLFVCSAPVLLLPVDEVAHSGAPMADLVRPFWGSAAATLVAVCAAVSAFGALNGWILVQGEMPWAMARDGVLPHWLSKRSARNTPVRSHVLSSILLTGVLFLNASKGLADLFAFIVVVTTLANLLPYVVCALAALKLRRRSGLQEKWLPPAALLATLFSGWAIWGSGLAPLLWCLALLALGVPFYLAARLGPEQPAED